MTFKNFFVQLVIFIYICHMFCLPCAFVFQAKDFWPFHVVSDGSCSALYNNAFFFYKSLPKFTALHLEDMDM